jgi:hypothetical protein
MSQDQADAPWWAEVYQRAFPAFSGMTYVANDCPAQRDGVDRLVTTRNGHVYRIDEKVRDKDWPDFFLEHWSVDRKVAGWVAKDLACDFIAYAFVPSQRCYLLPFTSLRRAWETNRDEWIRKYREKAVPNRGWVTWGVPVPIPVVLDAIRDSMLVTWGAPAEDPLDVEWPKGVVPLNPSNDELSPFCD